MSVAVRDLKQGQHIRVFNNPQVRHGQIAKILSVDLECGVARIEYQTEPGQFKTRNVEVTQIFPLAVEVPQPKPVVVAPQPKPTEDEIWRQILADPDRRYAVDLIGRLYKEYGITNHAQTVFRNIRGAYHHTPSKGRHQIVIGYECMTRMATKGFTEYKSIAWVWRGHGELTGRKGVWALVLHEFAHVLQTEVPNGVRPGSIHNRIFVEKLQELQVLFPYEETL